MPIPTTDLCTHQTSLPYICNWIRSSKVTRFDSTSAQLKHSNGTHSLFFCHKIHICIHAHTHKYIHILRRLHPQSNGKWKLLDYSVFLCLLKSQMSYKLIFCNPGYHAYVPLTGCHLNGDKLARESSNEMLHTGKISESMDQL